MKFTIEFDREQGGRWIAEIAAPPRVMAYGATRLEAQERMKALAAQVMAERQRIE